MTNNIDRRKLLLAGAAAAASPLAAQDQEIRTAHIGVGVRGGSLLKEAVSQQRIKISAICDIDGQTRDKALTMAARDNPKSLTEWRAVLDLKDVDAVFIGTPCDMHAEMAAACLEAGKYVYCEKPLGITPEEHRSCSESRAPVQDVSSDRAAATLLPLDAGGDPADP